MWKGPHDVSGRVKTRSAVSHLWHSPCPIPSSSGYSSHQCFPSKQPQEALPAKARAFSGILTGTCPLLQCLPLGNFYGESSGKWGVLLQYHRVQLSSKASVDLFCLEEVDCNLAIIMGSPGTLTSPGAYTSSSLCFSRMERSRCSSQRGSRSPMRMCSCILLAGIFSPVMGDTRYSSGAGAGGKGLEAKRKQMFQ